METLTQTERILMTAIKFHNEEHNFSFEDFGLNMKKYRGVASSLVKKGYIETFEGCYFDGALTKKGVQYINTID